MRRGKLSPAVEEEDEKGKDYIAKIEYTNSVNRWSYDSGQY